MSRLSVVHSGKNDPGALRRREFHFDARHQEQSVGGGDVVGVEQTVTQTRQLLGPALCLRTDEQTYNGSRLQKLELRLYQSAVNRGGG